MPPFGILEFLRPSPGPVFKREDRAWQGLGFFFFCLEAQIEELGIYTAWVCQMISQSFPLDHVGCADAARVELRARAVSPSILFLLTFHIRIWPVGALCIHSKVNVKVTGKNVKSLSNNHEKPFPWKATAYDRPIEKG